MVSVFFLIDQATCFLKYTAEFDVNLILYYHYYLNVIVFLMYLIILGENPKKNGGP